VCVGVGVCRPCRDRSIVCPDPVPALHLSSLRSESARDISWYLFKWLAVFEASRLYACPPFPFSVSPLHFKFHVFAVWWFTFGEIAGSLPPGHPGTTPTALSPHLRPPWSPPTPSSTRFGTNRADRAQIIVGLGQARCHICCRNMKHYSAHIWPTVLGTGTTFCWKVYYLLGPESFRRYD
jgi:hypothetical protein